MSNRCCLYYVKGYLKVYSIIIDGLIEVWNYFFVLEFGNMILLIFEMSNYI